MVTSISNPTIFITIASESISEELLFFHKKHLTEFLFPRNIDFFRKLIADSKIFIARESISNELIGLCYIDNEAEELCKNFGRHEFGGLYLIKRYQGKGLAEALCIISLSHNFTNDRTTGRIVSHIHELNQFPVKLFQKNLHFLKVGFEVVPRWYYRKLKNMNFHNKILVGELYSLYFHNFKHYAHWMNNFKSNSFQVLKNNSVIQIDTDLLSIQYIDDTINTLNTLSSETARDVHKCKKCTKVKKWDHFIRYNRVVRFFYTLGL